MCVCFSVCVVMFWDFLIGRWFVKSFDIRVILVCRVVIVFLWVDSVVDVCELCIYCMGCSVGR